MSAVANIQEAKKQPEMIVRVVGRINNITDGKDYVFFEIACKAVDEYSMPPVLNVSSRRSLGRVGDNIDILCHLGGYPRKGNQGGRFVTNTLTVIE